MEEQNAIEVKDIKKSFKVYFDKANQLKDKVLFWKRNRYERREVLKGISFSVKKGEAIGLVGHNGCGKSTSLKLLTKIMYPDSGTIEMKGRISALIELGAGFHPDMSGRENIYTNAAIFGLTRKEIDKRVDEIIAFSELEEFIDNPVRTYSSGMYMRLAFAVAINVDADILLIDEILAVGDAAFQKKCFDRIKEIKEQGTTIVIVSHSLGQIEEICERSIWIDDGLIRAQGTPKNVHGEYLDFMGVIKEEDKQNTLENFEKLSSAKIESSSNGAYIICQNDCDCLSLKFDIKLPVAHIEIQVEGSEAFVAEKVSEGKKVFNFPLKTGVKKESRIWVGFNNQENAVILENAGTSCLRSENS